MNFTCLLFGAAFVLFGALFAHGNLHIHLKAWTRMPADEKEKIKIKPLCRNVGGMIAACGGVFLLAGVSPFFLSRMFVWCMILWMVAAGIDVYLIGKSKRFCR